MNEKAARAHRMESHVCGVCKQSKRASMMIACDVVRPAIAEALDGAAPDWRQTGWICREDLREFRRRTVSAMIRRERGELSESDREVIDSIGTPEVLTENTEEKFDEALTLGDRVADRVASFAGSWTFILSFLALMLLWMVVNVLPLIGGFDPYPFILLNLILSMIAAFQAPLIMMSQRRQEEKDRMRALNDYRINLKAELEIRHLHEKLDHILIDQWERLSKIQEAQLDLFEELSENRKGR